MHVDAPLVLRNPSSTPYHSPPCQPLVARAGGIHAHSTPYRPVPIGTARLRAVTTFRNRKRSSQSSPEQESMQNRTSAVAAAHFAMFYCTKQPGELYLEAFVNSLLICAFPAKVSYTPKSCDAARRATLAAQPSTTPYQSPPCQP